MEDNDKNIPSEPQDDYPEEFIDEVTKNKIDRHLHDINDTISEQDIKNVVTDIHSPAIPDQEKDNAKEDPSVKKDGKDDAASDEMPTSWNILK